MWLWVLEALREYLSTIVSIVTILSSIAALSYWLGRKFAEIDDRFKQIDDRFKQIDDRFKQIDEKLKHIEARLDSHSKELRELRGYTDAGLKELKEYTDKRFSELKEYTDKRFKELKEYVDGKFSELKEYTDRRFSELREYTDKRFNELKEYVDGRFDRVDGEIERLRGYVGRVVDALSRASVEAYSVLIEYMGVKGLVEEKEAAFLKRRVAGVYTVYKVVAHNPLSKEELEFILRTFNKPLNEITIEEMDKAYELGKRIFAEDLDERGFLLAIAAATIRAYLRSKQEKEGEGGE